MENINIQNTFKPQVRSQLVKLPYEKIRTYCNLIDKNIGEMAILVVRPRNPIKLTTKLNEAHKVQVSAGWIQSITIVQQEDLAMHEGQLLLKTDIEAILKAKDKTTEPKLSKPKSKAKRK